MYQKKSWKKEAKECGGRDRVRIFKKMKLVEFEFYGCLVYDMKGNDGKHWWSYAFSDCYFKLY